MAKKKSDGMHVAFVRDGLSVDDTFIALLEYVRSNGSIAMAAKKMGVSYSFAHSSIRNMDEAMGTRLVQESGEYAAAGSQLTPMGESLIADYCAIRDGIASEGDAFLSRYLGRAARRV
ncbi:MAG: LysR family transcriptional regulator [Coriobacteriales bacterium]|nr:LysR family transcriptional regulator [Coriobacteriales bacterium]